MEQTNDIISSMEVESDLQQQETSFRRKVENFYDFLACWTFHLMIICAPFVFLFICTKSSLRIFALPYLIWMYYDRETPYKGGRKLNWLRQARFWRYRRDYFPIELIKTTDMPPDTTYLFTSFPHGLVSLAATTNFLTDANRFEHVFPGLNLYACALDIYFKIPFLRDLSLFSGFCPCSRESISHILNGPPGNVALLLPGGVAEIMISHPGTNRLVLKNRKGFVKIAMQAGSSLVPVYTFGENDAYDQPFNGSWYKRLQKIRFFGGTGFFFFRGPLKLTHLFGLLPYQIPLTTVVGKPIPLPKLENPSDEEVDKYHQIFIQELTLLFEKYKLQYDSKGEQATLSIE